MNNKKMAAMLLAVMITTASTLAACSTSKPNVPEVPEESTIALKVETTADEETTVNGIETTLSTTVSETTAVVSDPKITTTVPFTTKPVTTTKPTTTTTTRPVTTTKPTTTTTTRPVTTTKPTTTTTTRPVTTTKPTTTTTQPTTTAPQGITKAEIDQLVKDATAYGRSLGMGVNNSLTIGNSSWNNPASTKVYDNINGMRDRVYYQVKKWSGKVVCDGSPAFKVVSKSIGGGHYEVYVLIG